MKYKHLFIIILLILDISFFFTTDGKVGSGLFLFSIVGFCSLMVTFLVVVNQIMKFFIENWDEKISDKK